VISLILDNIFNAFAKTKANSKKIVFGCNLIPKVILVFITI
jgi:hypothetical protein